VAVTPGRVPGPRPGLLEEEGPQMARMMIDCRTMPSEIGCTLTIAGEEQEVLDAAVLHAVDKHGHESTAELREMIRGGLVDAEPALA
jgi:predicted small metal-binding protein